MQDSELTEKVLAGEMRAAARVMRGVDEEEPWAVEVLKALHPRLGRAYVLGVTGSPGVGKSTLTDALIGAFRGQGKTVGVVAVDPTSPFSGGALLGDRIRMQGHALDEGVFIRSLATRGAFGGITASTRGIVAVMDAMGKDVVIVETVGVGQDEVEVARMADTTLIVTVPGLGDDIQAIKAGILEAGDVFVVNKCDRDGAKGTAAQLESMIALGQERHQSQGWTPPVVLTAAGLGQGMDDLVAAVESHHQHLLAEGGENLAARRTERARREILDLAQRRFMARFLAALEAGPGLDELSAQVAAGEKDPYTTCDQLLAALVIDPTQGG